MIIHLPKQGERQRRECSELVDLLRSNSELRDCHPERALVTSLEHGLQMADRMRYAGYSDQWVAVGLLHDAAKPLNETFHGQAIAEILREYVTEDQIKYLRGHSIQAYGEKPTKLGLLDARSFDPRYFTPSFDEMLPYIEKLYGLAP